MKNSKQKHPGFPKNVKAGGVVVKVYRVRHSLTKGGFAFSLRAGARNLGQFSTLEKAMEEARLKAAQLQAGRIEAADLSREDRDQLLEARKICGQVPLLAALQEWSRARTLTNGHILPACEAWAIQNQTAKFTRVLVSDAVDQFIKEKEKLKKQGERTYRSKLSPLGDFFKDRYLDSIGVAEFTAYLEQWDDSVTRNDFRKRAITLSHWALKHDFLPGGLALAAEKTERAAEKPTEIGIISPEVFGELLRFFREKHPEYLTAVVLAGFTGIRSDEVHGKRQDRALRQMWEDVHLNGEHPFLQVTVAKRNTPSWRTTPLDIFEASGKRGGAAAVAWLKLCPAPHEGPVCKGGAMERVRHIADRAGFKLPENSFRHSFITYAVALNGNKAQVATWAGNSEKEIDRRYRRGDITPDIARRWFSMTPEKASALPTTVPPKKVETVEAELDK